MTYTFDHHVSAIESGTITQSNLIGLRKIFNHIARIERGLSGNRCNVTSREAEFLMGAIHNYRPRIVGDWHESGLAMLRNKRYERQLGPVSHMLPLVGGFRLVTFEMFDRLHHVAIYETRDCEGGHLFNFRNIPWQSGGNGPEIVP